MKIRFKLLILFLQISLIPMFFLGFVAYSNSEKAISSQAIARLETIANFQKARIEDLNKQHKETLKDFTSRLQLRVETNNYNQTQSVASQTKLTDILLAAKKSSPSHSNIYIINPAGLVIASTDKEIFGQNKVTGEVFLKGK